MRANHAIAVQIECSCCSATMQLGVQRQCNSVCRSMRFRRHVISGAGGVRINLANGDWRSAEVVAVDLAQDVAVLRIEGAPGQPVAIAPAMPRQGHAVATIGAPQGWGFSLSAGVVSRYGTAPGMFATLPMLQIAVPVSSGNSGGVVINAKGEAVGLVSFGQPEFNQAVPIGRVLDVAGLDPSYQR